MNVGLIYPAVTAGRFGASADAGERTWMHHGLAILSSALKRAGHEVTLIDLRRLAGWDAFRERIAAERFDAVGITIMSVDIDPALQATRIVKELWPETPVFAGGPHATICPDELEPEASIDCLVKGQGEITFPKLLDQLTAGERPPAQIQGEPPIPLDLSPWADRGLFETTETPIAPFFPEPFVTLIAGRGCKYVCNYCQPAEQLLFGKKVNRRSVDDVIGELKQLQSTLGFRSFMFHDDCLTEDPEWVTAFCKRYKEEQFTQPFACQSRADLIVKHRDMIEAMVDAGLRMVLVGFESGSNRVLKYLRKGCTRKLNLEAAVICRELGIKVWANYMLGVPTETKAEALETLSMLEQIRPYHCSPAFYTPHPGSDLFEIGKEMGIHLVAAKERYRRGAHEPKIKGPDYRFLQDLLTRSCALAEDQVNPVAEGRSLLDAIPLARRGRNRLRIALMAHTPSLYRVLRQVRGGRS